MFLTSIPPAHLIRSRQGLPGLDQHSLSDILIGNTSDRRTTQILYLDQRGTGLSNPISADTVLQKGDRISQQARWLSLFRADNIGMRIL